MNKDTLCDDLQKLNDEEVQSFFIQDAITLIRQQQAEIEALKEAIISENEACAQILLDSYDTTEPYEYINPDWLLTLVDLIDDRVGRVRT